MKAWWWGLQQPESCWLLLASLCLFHPTGIISFSSKLSSTRPGWYWVLTASLWLNHPLGIISFFSMVSIIFCIVCLNLTIPSTRKHLFLKSAFHRARILLVITGLPLPIPSTRNHLFLLYGVFNRDRIMFGIAVLPAAIPSPMNHHQSTLNRARIMLGIACPPLTIIFTRNHSCLYHLDHVGYCWPLSYCFIHQESYLSLATGIFSFSYMAY